MGPQHDIGHAGEHRSQLVEPLFRAIKDRYSTVERVRGLLQEIGAKNQLDSAILDEGLLTCCEQGRADIAKALIEYGAKPTAQTDDGKTALMLAATVDVVDLLLERDVDINATDNEGATALMYALQMHANPKIAELLIEKGANVNAADRRGRTVITWATWKNRISVIEALLNRGVDLTATDERKWNVVHHLAYDRDRATRSVHGNNSGTDRVVDALRDRAHFNAQDKFGRTPLHWAASSGNCHLMEILIKDFHADVHAIDHQTKTPLHVAAAYNKIDAVKVLLSYRADVDAHRDGVTARMPDVNIQADGGWTPLHSVCQYAVRTSDNLPKRDQTSKDTNLASSGQTNAGEDRREAAEERKRLESKRSSDAIKTIETLLKYKADPNRKTYGGKTALHVAAEVGNTLVVSWLLKNTKIQRDARDAFGYTALTSAARLGHHGIIQLFAPKHHALRLSLEEQQAAKGFEATCTDFGSFREQESDSEKTRDYEVHHDEHAEHSMGGGVGKTRMLKVFDLLYGERPILPKTETPNHGRTASAAQETGFRWLHLPANDMIWCQELLTKWFIEQFEQDVSDVESFRAFERSFNHQHRGQHPHSHYMRPICQFVPRVANSTETAADDGFSLGVERSATISSDPGFPTDLEPNYVSESPTTAFSDTEGGPEALPSVSAAAISAKNKPANVGMKIGEGASPRPLKTDRISAKAKADLSNLSANHMFIFMPYLHFETNGKRSKMQEQVKKAWGRNMKLRGPYDQLVLPQRPKCNLCSSCDYCGHRTRASHCHCGQCSHCNRCDQCDYHDRALIWAHVQASNTALHIRRTLDQSFYRNIDTTERDDDQVIDRYQDPRRKQLKKDESKVLMVDQLWMWIVGRDLVITSFPQRWQQGRNDPYDVFGNIVEAINSTTRHRVQNVYELAIVIASCCSGAFPRYGAGSDETPFLDMFEATIGSALEKETNHFKSFRYASKEASEWLWQTRFTRRGQPEVSRRASGSRKQPDLNGGKGSEDKNDDKKGSDRNDEREDAAEEPDFIDVLLDIEPETGHLRESRDIHDELDMLKVIFENQDKLVSDLRDTILGLLDPEGKKVKTRKLQGRVESTLEDQKRNIEHSLKDIERMTRQAERMYHSITKLLDLKQKHANAIEARYSTMQATDTAEQAAETARQGKTLMVFTIVTVIFLPLSFLAAFFAIDIAELPHDRKGNQSMPLAFVSRLVFGVGLSVAVVCVISVLFFDKLALSAKRLAARPDPQHNRVGSRSQKNRAVASKRPVLGTSGWSSQSSMKETANGRPLASVRVRDIERGDLDDSPHFLFPNQDTAQVNYRSTSRAHD